MRLFEWKHFHQRALLYPQRCCQGHGAANAASREGQLSSATAALLGESHYEHSFS
jgi:hypothetical protein